jgi:hypothetical protein
MARGRCNCPRGETRQRQKDQRFAHQANDREGEQHEGNASKCEQQEEVARFEHADNILPDSRLGDRQALPQFDQPDSEPSANKAANAASEEGGTYQHGEGRRNDLRSAYATVGRPAGSSELLVRVLERDAVTRNPRAEGEPDSTEQRHDGTDDRIHRAIISTAAGLGY